MARDSRIWFAVTLVALLALLAGCKGQSAEEAKREWLDRIELLTPMHETAVATVTQAREALALAVAAGEESWATRAIEALDKAITKETEVRLAIEAAERAIESIDTEAPSWAVHAQAVGATAQSAAPFLPPPWNGVVLIAGSLIGTAGAAYGTKKKADARKAESHLGKLVYAIDEAKAADETLQTGLAKAKPVIRASMGAATAAKVDELRR